MCTLVCMFYDLLARRFGWVFISLYKKGTRSCWSTERDWVAGLVYDIMHNGHGSMFQFDGTTSSQLNM